MREQKLLHETSDVDVPLLLIGFNRPEYTKNLIDSLREIKPTKIYFAVDGPRISKKNDVEKVNLVRALISTIDWDCEIKSKFNSENLGCKLGPVSAINWIFEHEEKAIILEDDIRPSKSFFQFCTELLDKYENDENIFFIAGSNFLNDKYRNESYRFASVFYVWGWATWRRAWKEYTPDISTWKKEIGVRGIKEFFGCSWIQAFILGRYIFESIAKDKLQAWDYQLIYHAIKTRKLAINSNFNLVENVGFGLNATHTFFKPDFLLPRKEIEFPLVPPKYGRDSEADIWILNNAYGLVSYKTYLKSILKKLFFRKVKIIKNLKK